VVRTAPIRSARPAPSHAASTVERFVGVLVELKAGQAVERLGQKSLVWYNGKVLPEAE
jgi:hypothetical protein